MNASFWIEKLQLIQHPEGGCFKETYRAKEGISKENLPSRFTNDCSFSTAIYFLLKDKEFSAFHRIHSDELWHFYSGNTLNIYVIHLNGILEIIQLGADIENGEVFQAMVPAGCWFASRLAEPKMDTFALVGCTVAPGFDFADFEMAKQENLAIEFPMHATIITELTIQE